MTSLATPPPSPTTTALPLPKFTFLFGDQREELAKLISDQDDEMLLCDLEEPLRMATCDIVYGGFTLEHDLTKPEERNKLISRNPDMTPAGLIYRLEGMLREAMGPGALGKIALRQFEENGFAAMFDRVLVRDIVWIGDVQPFIDKYDAKECCLIFAGNTFKPITGTKWIILPQSTAQKQFEALQHELGVTPNGS